MQLSVIRRDLLMQSESERERERERKREREKASVRAKKNCGLPLSRSAQHFLYRRNWRCCSLSALHDNIYICA